jgi:membrane-associated phospholipid phosphatase
MPSLHIATTVWMVLAFTMFARRWTWIVAAPGALIFLLSISLGWHYAVDGIVGGLAALGYYALCLRVLDPAQRRLALAPHSTGIQQA